MSTYLYQFQEGRGTADLYVTNEKGDTVWEAHYPEFYTGEDGEMVEASTIFEDGSMKDANDVKGLEKYLKSIEVIQKDDTLTDEEPVVEVDPLEGHTVEIYELKEALVPDPYTCFIDSNMYAMSGTDGDDSVNIFLGREDPLNYTHEYYNTEYKEKTLGKKISFDEAPEALKKQILIRLEHGNSFEDGGETETSVASVEERVKSRIKGAFELPLQIAVYVPSTKDKDAIITKKEMQKRITEVESFLATLFGGFSAGNIEGGFQSTDKGLVSEDVVRVVSYANVDEGNCGIFENKFAQLIEQLKKWCVQWSQESMGLEFENDLFYIDANTQFKDGGIAGDVHSLVDIYLRSEVEKILTLIKDSYKFKAYFLDEKDNSLKVIFDNEISIDDSTLMMEKIQRKVPVEDYHFDTTDLGYVLTIPMESRIVFAKGGTTVRKSANVPRVQKKVDEVNRLIALAKDSNGDAIAVIDKPSTWEEPTEYKPVIYSNGVLYFEWFLPYRNETEKTKVLKADVEFDGIPALNAIAKLYRAALKKEGIKYEDGGIMEQGSFPIKTTKYFIVEYPAFGGVWRKKVHANSERAAKSQIAFGYGAEEDEVKILESGEATEAKKMGVYNFADGGEVSDNQRIAKEILAQLGGRNKLIAMTGAYNFSAIQNGLSFRLKSRKANYVKIVLNAMDLYDVEIGKIHGDNYKVTYNESGIWFDQLKPIIERETGMYLSLESGGEVKGNKTKVTIVENDGEWFMATPYTLVLLHNDPFNNKEDAEKYAREAGFAVVYDDFNEDIYAKGGLTNEEKLTKELHKLQRELNSSRLNTYTEGDESEEEKRRQIERQSKLNRFNEILGLLRESDKKESGGEVKKQNNYVEPYLLTQREYILVQRKDFGDEWLVAYETLATKEHEAFVRDAFASGKYNDAILEGKINSEKSDKILKEYGLSLDSFNIELYKGDEIKTNENTAQVLIISNKKPLYTQLEKILGEDYHKSNFEEKIFDNVSVMRDNYTGKTFVVFTLRYVAQVDENVIKDDLSFIKFSKMFNIDGFDETALKNYKFGNGGEIKKVDLGFGSLGNGTTVYDRNREEHGDYKKVAHISENGVIKYYDEKLPDYAIAEIEKEAKKLI